jgi:hypothetical protein
MVLNRPEGEEIHPLIIVIRYLHFKEPNGLAQARLLVLLAIASGRRMNWISN